MSDMAAGGFILRSDQENSVQIVADCLLGGGVCVLPTDTVYGFSGIVPHSKGNIQKIKGRDEGKPFIQLVSSPEDVFQYIDVGIGENGVLGNRVSKNATLQALFSLWPGALTIILPVSRGCDAGSTAAFRCPGDNWLRQVIARVGMPIYSTSVNRSGQPVLNSIHDIKNEFGGEVDLIVDGGASVSPGALPSTLVEILPESGCRILRQGSVKIPEKLLA